MLFQAFLSTALQRYLSYHFRSAKSGKRDSNSRPSPWQGDALPLSHFRMLFQAFLSTALQRYLSYHCFINNASLFYNFFHFIFHVHHSFIIPYKNCSYCMTFTYLSYHCFINNASLFYNFFHFIFHVHHSFIIPYKNCSYCMTFTLFLPKNRVS